MSYTPTTWQTGDTITAAGLNKIEQGIADAGSSGGAVIITDNGTALDYTYAEIYELITAGTPCYVKYKDRTPSDLDEEYSYFACVMPVVGVRKYSDAYRVLCENSLTQYVGNSAGVGVPQLYTYTAADAESYPTFYRSSYVVPEYMTTVNSRF